MKRFLKILWLTILTFSIFAFSLIIKTNDEKIILESSGIEIELLLREAVDISILKILGSKRDFEVNKRTIRDIPFEKFIKEYVFLEEKDMELLQVSVDIISLRKYLLGLDLGISIDANQTISIWIFCREDYSSIEASKALEQKCNNFRRDLLKISSDRGVKTIFPIFDTRDISLLKIEEGETINDLVFFNDRYLSDGWIFCEISSLSDWCYLPFNEQDNFSKVDFSSRYKPNIGLNILIDNLLGSKRLNPNSEYQILFSLIVNGLETYEVHRNVFDFLKESILIKNLKLELLRNEQAKYSLSLLRPISEFKDFLKKRDLLEFVSEDKNIIFVTIKK